MADSAPSKPSPLRSPGRPIEPGTERRKLIGFLIKSLFWGGLLYFLSSNIASSNLGFALVAILVASTPIALVAIYGATIRQIRGLEIFAQRGVLYRLFSGRPLKIIFWLVWSLFCSFFLLLQFSFFTPNEWQLLLLVLPVFWLSYLRSMRTLQAELKSYLVVNQALLVSRWLAAAVMTVLYLGLLFFTQESVDYASLREAVDPAALESTTADGSALLSVAASYFSMYENIKVYAIVRLGTLDSFSALLLIALGSFVVFFNACVFLSCFLIPLREYRRLLTPLSNSDLPAEPQTATVGMTVAISTFLTLFICLPLLGYLEAWLQRNPEIGYRAQAARSQVIVRLEQIDDVFFTPGTLLELEEARVRALQEVEASLVRVEGEAANGFLQMEANVDTYLDWYYSLTAEYGRIGTLLVGNLEEYMTENLREVLTEGEVFAATELALENALTGHEEAQRLYQQSARDIMASNRVEPAADEQLVLTGSATLADILNPPSHQQFIDFDQRMRVSGGGAAAGAIGGVIVAKVITKVAGKSTIKLAATATSKVVASKALGSSAGAGAGAVAGAALGSIVPGLGTAVGAVIGGVVSGIAVGVTIDKALIEIDELMNREEFKAELVLAIHEARDEFLVSLR